MHARRMAAVAAITALAATGAAVASHVTQVDPATVPTGFLAAHNSIGDVPVSALARAVTPDGTDAFIQHVRLGAQRAHRLAHPPGTCPRDGRRWLAHV